MKLATIRTASGTRAARLAGHEAVLLDAVTVVDLLSREDWRAIASGTGSRSNVVPLDFAPVVTPQRVICVGLNYRSHILEMGRDVPQFPTLFAKFPTALTGPYDEIRVPSVSTAVDWEVELGVVIGRPTYRVDADEALAAIAGYTVVNDISMRDWQQRTLQWFQGKNFDQSTPVGPVLVTTDEFGESPPDLAIMCEVDGATMQKARTSDLVFGPAELISYVSSFMALVPGDLIATGTPGGVGASQDDTPYIQPGQVVKAWIEGIGACENVFIEDKT